jgi:phenylacetate-coenzyme A ligase PaaK-like adenylate-forming protein
MIRAAYHSASPHHPRVDGLDPSETWTDAARKAAQRGRRAALLAEVVGSNPFYRAKLGPKATVDAWADLPFTTKGELSEDQATHPPFGSNLTYPVERYTRLHQTSGTTGKPLRILDTADSWEWWKETWRFIYRACGVTAADRVFFCFSFGPFIGFWSAFAGAEHLGALAMSGGAMSSSERVAAILSTRATVLVCTPSSVSSRSRSAPRTERSPMRATASSCSRTSAGGAPRPSATAPGTGFTRPADPVPVVGRS